MLPLGSPKLDFRVVSARAALEKYAERDRSGEDQ